MHSDRILGRSEGTLTRPALFDPSPYHDSPRPSCLRCRTIRLRCRTTLTARLQTRRFVFIARPCDFRFRIVVVDAVAVPRPEQLRMVMARSPKSPKARRNGTFGVVRSRKYVLHPAGLGIAHLPFATGAPHVFQCFVLQRQGHRYVVGLRSQHGTRRSFCTTEGMPPGFNFHPMRRDSHRVVHVTVDFLRSVRKIHAHIATG